MNDVPATAALDAALPPATHVSHLHLLALVNTRLQRIPADPVRLCDMGCGDGALLAYLATCLPLLNPGRKFEFFGVDVSDSGVQADGFFARTRETLDQAQPSIDWSKQLHLVRSSDPWPFDDATLTVIVSNQVIEHVTDHAHFFAESYRTLQRDGVGCHLFPLKHVLWEGHIGIPLAHRVLQHSLRRAWIAAWSRVGVGSYAAHRRVYGMTLDQYAEEHADYLDFLTNYRSSKEILALVKAARLRGDFEHSAAFYACKLRAMRRRAPRYRYGQPNRWIERLLFPGLKRLASVTLTTEKRQSYAR